MRKLLLFLSLIFTTASTAETININWKVNGTNYAQSTCQTGSNLILPATAPTKYGYVFRGWEVNSLITGTVKTGSKNLWNKNSQLTLSGYTDSQHFYLSGPTYTISATVNLVSGDVPNCLLVYNKCITWPGDGGRISASFTNTMLEDFRFYSGQSAADAQTRTIRFSDIQIEEGTTATAYEPYNGLSVPSPTNPVEPEFYTVGNIVLRALGTGDSAIADTYDLKTGKITRRVGVAVFKGTENWTKYSGNNWTFLYPLAGLYDFNKLSYVLSTHFQKMAGWNSKSGIYLGNNVTNGIHIGADGLFSDINSFKQWLAEQYNAGTPLTVYYPLATPTEENPN